MFRKSVAAASVLGSAALAVAALTSPASVAATNTAANAAMPATSAPSSALALIHQTHRHGHLVTTFHMVRSGAAVAAKCLPNAKATVEITSKGPVEVMKVAAKGLPKKTDFDFFVIQVPDAKFGLSWYQGDLESNKHGRAHGTFIGRFSEETFIVAPGSEPAPVEHTSPIADASTNPATAPVHEFHLGFWFNSPKDAAAAGCGAAVTPFNGEHNAGVQAMSTRQFPALAGPLGHIAS